jgi:VIT1/CCC1 family predicted Fe2+/Mn2+ transporter
MAQCAEQVIQQTTAQAALNQATSDYMNCLGPQERGAAALQGAQVAIDRAVKEADGLAFLNKMTLNQLQKETGDVEILGELADIAVKDTEKMQTEIEQLKSQIRTERRKFLDSDPSVSPAAGGLYFTKNTDNQLLIAFLSCFGVFLLVASVAYAMGYIPLINKPTGSEVVKIIATFLVVSLVLMYLGFYMFT